MINLIPKEEKKKIAEDFYYRFAVISTLALGWCILIGAVVMVPSYFLSSTKMDLVNKKLEIQKKEPIPLPDQQTLETIKGLNKKLALIENAENIKFDISSKVINPILLTKTPDIKITNISYQNDSLKGKKISVEGIAPSREVLLLFRQALEDGMDFKQVDLPISNFVKGSNIKFYLSLIPS